VTGISIGGNQLNSNGKYEESKKSNKEGKGQQNTGNGTKQKRLKSKKNMSK